MLTIINKLIDLSWERPVCNDLYFLFLLFVWNSSLFTLVLRNLFLFYEMASATFILLFFLLFFLKRCLYKNFYKCQIYVLEKRFLYFLAKAGPCRFRCRCTGWMTYFFRRLPMRRFTDLLYSSRCDHRFLLLELYVFQGRWLPSYLSLRISK